MLTTANFCQAETGLPTKVQPSQAAEMSLGSEAYMEVAAKNGPSAHFSVFIISVHTFQSQIANPTVAVNVVVRSRGINSGCSRNTVVVVSVAVVRSNSCGSSRSSAICSTDNTMFIVTGVVITVIIIINHQQGLMLEAFRSASDT